MSGSDFDEVDEPPRDPEAWSDEQWIAWLEATDEAAAARLRPAGARRRARRPASMLGSAMTGLHDVLYGRPDEVVIVADAGGDPPGEGGPEVHLDPDHPERSEVIVRRQSTGSQP